MLNFVEAGRGPAVVLLHAFPMDGSVWQAQVGSLADAGYRAISIDLPGFGGSPVSMAVPSLDVMADAVAETMDGLGLSDAVVGGLSMGGYVAMAMIRRHASRLSSVILADTKATADDSQGRMNRLRMAEGIEATGSTSGLAEAMLPNLLGPRTHDDHPEVVAFARKMIQTQSPTGVAWAQRAMAARPDSTSDLTQAGLAALVLRGTDDAISSREDCIRMVRAVESGGESSRLVEIPDAGHLCPVEAPEAVNEALTRWLAALP